MKRKRKEDTLYDECNYPLPSKKRKLESYEMRKEDIPTHLMRYWYTRYFRFSKFDEGLWLNLDCLSESTYEEIARHTSVRVSESLVNFSDSSKGITVLDAMCGCGVSTIQFALNPNIKKVISVEISGEKIMFAKHNCQIYGVDLSKIEFIEDDIFNFFRNAKQRYSEKIDACFMSPPWGGGVDYKDRKDFTLNDIQFNIHGKKNENGISLFNEAIKNVTRNIAYSLPLDTSRQGFEKLNYSGTIEAETNYFNNKKKTKTFYFGDLVTRQNT